VSVGVAVALVMDADVGTHTRIDELLLAVFTDEGNVLLLLSTCSTRAALSLVVV
jgi:hypothetical protein